MNPKRQFTIVKKHFKKSQNCNSLRVGEDSVERAEWVEFLSKSSELFPTHVTNEVKGGMNLRPPPPSSPSPLVLTLASKSGFSRSCLSSFSCFNYCLRLSTQKSFIFSNFFLSRTRSYEEIFSVNLHYVEIQALLKADLSHVTGHTQSEGLNSRKAQIYAENFFLGFGPNWKPTQADLLSDSFCGFMRSL